MAKKHKRTVDTTVETNTTYESNPISHEEMLSNEPPYISNVSSYTFEHAVSAALNSSVESGGAEAEMVCSLFNDERWNLDALENYFGAAKSQRIVRDGKQFTDTTIDTRKTIEHNLLLSVPQYYHAIEALSAAKTEVRFANKNDALAVAKAKIKVKKVEEPILATRQMLHRAFQSLYGCHIEGYISVRIGDNGELLVTTADNEEKPFTATNVRKMGNAALKGQGLISTRAPRTTVADNAANVSVDNLDATLSAIGRLVEDETYQPELDGMNDLAETALRFVLKITRNDVEKDDELRGTVSQIVAALMPVIGAKTIKEVDALVKRSANGA